MIDKAMAQWHRCTLIKHDTHLRCRKRAPGGVLENALRLFKADARKPLDKLGQRGARLKVLKEGRDGHTAAAKDPGPAHHVRMALYSWTG